MHKWPTKPLGELCQLINGRAFKPSDWGKDGLPIVRIQNLNDHEKSFNFFSGEFKESHFIDDGAILLSWSGTPGTSFGCFRWNRGPGILNQHIFKVLVDESVIDGDFFIYSVNSRLEEMIGKAHGGVGLRHITKGKLEAIRLPIPELDEQRRIVFAIGECNRRVDEIIQLRRESRSQYQFLLESVIESELSTAGGKETALGDVCAIMSPLVDPCNSRYRNLTHVGGANIETATGRLVNLKTVLDEKVTSAKFTFDCRMVLYNKIRPYLKKVAKPEFDGLCSADMYPLLPKEDRLSRNYLFYLLLSRSFTSYAVEGSNRAGMPKVNRDHLFAYRFRLPSLEVQNLTAATVDKAFLAIENLRDDTTEAESDISTLRDAVLRKAFAGEL